MTDVAFDLPELPRRSFLRGAALLAAIPIASEATLAHAKMASQALGLRDVGDR